MTNRFSGALQLTDLDDFITPSQECIKPIEIKKRSSHDAKIKIRQDGYYQENKIGQIEKLEKVEVTLNDCLACSGCITSAEEVLINQQNFSEVLKTLKSENKELSAGKSRHVVVSLAVQPILSLASKFKVEPDEIAERLVTLFKNLGADKVVEMSLAEDMALIESQNEFLERYQNAQGCKDNFPLLASSCPGWICYAEKTHGSFILPYISTVKSPQQIMGSLIKYNLGYSPDTIYHVTLMPCYDKKLEASRDEFFNSEMNAKDVDCVITTIELEHMMSEQGIRLESLEPSPLDYPWGRVSESALRGHEGSGSGGYAHHVLVHAAQQLFGMSVTEMHWTAVRNPDFTEVTLEKDSRPVLSFAIATGFRNIQNVVQKIKRGKSAYHYVEIMACPSGCLNGGAQIKPELLAGPKALVAHLEALYEALPKAPLRTGLVRRLYDDWLGGPRSDKCAALLRTGYKRVDKPQTPLNIKW